MVGKNPHRPEGKTDADNEHMQASRMKAGMPYESGLSDKHVHEADVSRISEPGRVPAEEQIGGSRPGVESRVRDAIERREAREEPDEE